MWYKKTLTDVQTFDVFVQAKPKAKNSKIIGLNAEKNAILIAIAAQPIDGEANAELVKFLSKSLMISKSQIEVLKGNQSKFKKLRISQIDEEDLIKLLEGV